MYWHGLAALLLGASAHIAQAAAQVITITQYPSTCSAIYTSGTRSVTVVQSTVTVSPVPWNDNMANMGTAFVLQALSDTTGGAGAATVTRWVMPNGYLTTDGSKAAQYIIKNGQLTTVDGGFVSTFEGIPYGTFAVSPTIGNINTTFKVVDGRLVWSNPLFTGGEAKLYQTPDGQQDPAHVVAQFYGAASNTWIPYKLYARPARAATEGTSVVPSMSSTALVSSIGDGMSSMQTPMSNSPYQTPTYSYQPTTGAGMSSVPGGSSLAGTSTPGGQVPTSPVQSSPAAPSPTNPVSPRGICGGDSGFYCSGDACCGPYGYCGTGSDYCGPGCQPEFGTCWSASTSWGSGSSTMASMSGVVSSPASSNPMASMTMTPSASMPISSSPSSSEVSPVSSDEPAPTYATCPADDGQAITDGYERQYTLGCGMDTTIGSYSSKTVEGGFNDCFAICDEMADCMAFTYQGGVNGVGAGICYFKNQVPNFVTVANGNRLVSAVRVRAASGTTGGVSSTTVPPNYSTYTNPSTPIGPDNPGGPQSRPSSSSSMETDMPMSMSMSMSGMPDMVTSSSAMPSSTLPVSPNGHCGTQGNGGTPEGFTCTGSLFGPCCSLSGFCGFSSEYCLAGCQSTFGECTPQDGNPITENGECGVDWGNQTCTGGIFGRCCSTSGFCGSDADYCAPENCDPEFGECDMFSSSSMMVISSTSMPGMMSSSSAPGQSTSAPGMMTSTPTSTQMMASSSSSSAAAAATSLCPGANGTTYTDPSGTQYTIMCGKDFNPGSFKILPADSFAACINLCISQTDQTCVGITFGSGQCYLKASVDSWVSNSGLDSAVLVGVFPPAAYSSSSNVMMSSSSSPMAMMSPSSSMMAASSSSMPISSSSVAMSSSSAFSMRAASSTTSSSSSRAASTTSSSSSSSRPASSTTSSRSSSSVAATTTTTTSTTSSSSPAVTTTTTSTTRTTTTTTSTSSSSASPYLVLPSPTPCDFGDPQGYDEDDSYCRIPLPFAMRLYAQSDTNTFASTNGFLSLSYGSSQYASQQFPASNIPNNTVAPFFDDLYLSASASPRQGIFFQIQGTAITYEWYVGRGGVADRIYHWTVKYDSAVPGVFTYTYYNTGGANDQGLYASIGMQGRNAAGAAVGQTYAYHVQSIAPGLVVVCDSNQNTCVTAS